MILWVIFIFLFIIFYYLSDFLGSECLKCKIRLVIDDLTCKPYPKTPWVATVAIRVKILTKIKCQPWTDFSSCQYPGAFSSHGFLLGASFQGCFKVSSNLWAASLCVEWGRILLLTQNSLSPKSPSSPFFSPNAFFLLSPFPMIPGIREQFFFLYSSWSPVCVCS